MGPAAMFAAYPVTLIPLLVVLRNLSDHIGRRPALLAGLSAIAAGAAAGDRQARVEQAVVNAATDITAFCTSQMPPAAAGAAARLLRQLPVPVRQLRSGDGQFTPLLNNPVGREFDGPTLLAARRL